MSLQLPDTLPEAYFTPEYPLQAVKAFDKYISDLNIHTNEVYKQCLSEFDLIFPNSHYQIVPANKHIAIIGMMALKNAPYDEEARLSFVGGSKGGSGFAATHGTQILLLLFFLIMMWSSCRNMYNLVIDNNIEILDEANNFRPIGVVDIIRTPLKVGEVVTQYHMDAGAEELAKITKEMLEKAIKIANEDINNGLKDVASDFEDILPSASVEDDFFSKLSQWTSLSMNLVSGAFQERSSTIVQTRVSNILDNGIDRIMNENKLVLKKIAQDINIKIQAKVYTILNET